MDVDKPSTFTEPLVDDRVRLDPLDPKTARHMGQCEFASADDPSVLRVLLKVKPGLGEGYDWVECGSCGARLAGSALRRERRVTTNPLLGRAGSVDVSPALSFLVEGPILPTHSDRYPQGRTRWMPSGDEWNA